jgi:hypothetical protein
MEKIGIRFHYDLESKKKIVEDLAGIKEWGLFMKK